MNNLVDVIVINETFDNWITKKAAKVKGSSLLMEDMSLALQLIQDHELIAHNFTLHPSVYKDMKKWLEEQEEEKMMSSDPDYYYDSDYYFDDQKPETSEIAIDPLLTLVSHCYINKEYIKEKT